MLNDVIVALATPPLEGALAIIRVSGENSFSLLEKIFSNKSKKQSHKIYFGNIVENQEIIDEVLVLTFFAPNSFSGENSFEINCHGSMFIVEKILSLCIKNGARMANKGEFSKRAYLNDRIDLIQAEAINDMVFSSSEEDLKLAIYSLKGSTSNLIKDIKVIFLDLISNIEVNIDYPEYDDAEVVTKEIVIEKIKLLNHQIDLILKDAKIGKMIKHGINVAIVGKPNVGKSSLLNSLLQEHKAIVTPIAGTTRDIVEGSINLDGLKLNLLDTAGIRKDAEEIEQIGIQKAKETILGSDLILLVLDDSNILSIEDLQLLELTKDKNRIIVKNKTDLNKSKIDLPGIQISAKLDEIETLKKAIKEKVGFDIKKYENKPLITNVRHIGLLKAAKENLKQAKKEIEKGIPIDLVSIEIFNALKNIEDILGNRSRINIIDEIFSRFCLGK